MNRSVVSRRTFVKQSAIAAGSVCGNISGLKERVQAVVGGAQENPSRAVVAELEKSVPSLLTKIGVPGLSIALIQDAKIIWHRGFGVRYVTTKEPVTDETVYEAASLSKPTFAYAMLKMVERGILGLDDPLDQILPMPFMPSEPRLKLITARMLLSHTSGLPAARVKGRPLEFVLDPGKGFHSESTSNEMLKPQVEVGRDVSWGLGWGLLRAGSGDAFWHWGNWAGLYHHFAITLRDGRKGVVIMTNSGNGLKLCQQLTPMAIGIDIKPLSGFLR